VLGNIFGRRIPMLWWLNQHIIWSQGWCHLCQVFLKLCIPILMSPCAMQWNTNPSLLLLWLLTKDVCCWFGQQKPTWQIIRVISIISRFISLMEFFCSWWHSSCLWVFFWAHSRKGINQSAYVFLYLPWKWVRWSNNSGCREWWYEL